MIEVFPNLRKHLRSGEKVLWTGQPVPSKEYKTLRPILALLTLVIIAFVFLTVYQYYQAVQINPSFLNFDNMLRSLFDHSELRDVGFAFLATLFLLLFRLVLPHIINEDNKTIYAITNQRLMVIEPGKDPELKDYGPGEVQDPSIVKRGKSSGDLLFAAQVKQVGEVKDRGQTRREISWEGFFNVDDLDNAHQQLTEWRKKYAGIGRLVNKELSMEITVPPNWTSQPFYVDKGFRDNVFFSMLASEIMGESRPTLRSADYNEPWNTLLLTHQGFSHADQSDAQVHHFKILVEGAISADE
ncbi:hypothetical protein GWN26_02070, partial [Candidatus Saccharibacteria bacterium]|nr:hypothetical protein [Calditrichia bacterium]NIV71447.1 hypothetical protein [Calditrichia bacterium]NIV97988.1 hypothetical protein [Candidatus Saccharibacteria bacterium]NIW78466.1 hypothetical protein [Calditrichia bacterium]